MCSSAITLTVARKVSPWRAGVGLPGGRVLARDFGEALLGLAEFGFQEFELGLVV